MSHLRSHPDHSDCWSNYGSLLHDLGRSEEAKEMYLRAIRVDEQHTPAMFNLALLLQDEHQLMQAAKLYEHIIDIEPRSVDALSNLAACYHQLGLISEAVIYYRKAIDEANRSDSSLLSRLYEHLGRSLLRLPEDHALASNEHVIDAFSNALSHDPYNEVAHHLLAAQRQRGGESNPPENFVRKLFDDYAVSFERSLASLNYSAPQQIFEHLIREVDEGYKWGLVIDLGCGSGLMGQLLRAKCEFMLGIDLSPKMLFIADDKQIYALLVEGDVLALFDDLINSRLDTNFIEIKGSRKMRGSAVASLDQLRLAGFDWSRVVDTRSTLVAAADVFVYIGDLESLFQRIAGFLKAHDILTFTVEALDEENEFGWMLQRTGRFAHRKRYIIQLAEKYGFEVIKLESIIPRLEQGNEIKGYLAILRKGA